MREQVQSFASLAVGTVGLDLSVGFLLAHLLGKQVSHTRTLRHNHPGHMAKIELN